MKYSLVLVCRDSRCVSRIFSVHEVVIHEVGWVVSNPNNV